MNLQHSLLGEIKLPWRKGLSLLCAAAYGKKGSVYHCDKWNSYYALDFDRPWKGDIEPTTDIIAIADGIINSIDNSKTFGICVKISHINEIESFYAHLKEINNNLRLGQDIKQGQIIGLLGETGLAYGPHLHFQLFINGKCLKKTPEARPEPISDYCNLELDKWYKSNNQIHR